jgi:N-acyl-L-homoserine lactone synthetase
MALCLMPHQTRPDRAAMAFKPEALCLDASACSRPLTVQSTGCYPTRWAGHAILKPCHAATSLALLAEVLPATDRRRTPASPPARSARRRCRAARPEPLSRPAPAAATLPPFLRAAYRRRPAPQGRRDVLLQQIGRHVAAARANLKMSMTTINEPLTGLTGLPPVVDEMFRDRAIVFCEQLRWDLTTDKNGREIDPYDLLDPTYCIIETESGRHAGSVRLMPTTGRTMLGEIFPEQTRGIIEPSPLLWEVTRFCISPNITRPERRRGIAIMIMRSMFAFASERSIGGFAGVFYEPMMAAWRRWGWEPRRVSRSPHGGDIICVGVWKTADYIHYRPQPTDRDKKPGHRTLFWSPSER